jgi:hypothetical protein
LSQSIRHWQLPINKYLTFHVIRGLVSGNLIVEQFTVVNRLERVDTSTLCRAAQTWKDFFCAIGSHRAEALPRPPHFRNTDSILRSSGQRAASQVSFRRLSKAKTARKNPSELSQNARTRCICTQSRVITFLSR